MVMVMVMVARPSEGELRLKMKAKDSAITLFTPQHEVALIEARD
jgi:hypothetical protein